MRPRAGAHGPAAARNAGWRAARGAIIAFTDDDCIPDPRWLAAGGRRVRDGRDGGRPAGSSSRCRSGRRTTSATPPAWRGPSSSRPIASCRRDVLEAVGGFDERFAAAWREDSDLHFALLERGGRIGRAPGRSWSTRSGPAPWGVSLRQQRKSLFNALLFKKYPELYRRRIRSAPPWDYYAIVGGDRAAAARRRPGRRASALAAAGRLGGPDGPVLRRRLRRKSPHPGTWPRWLVTSALIPPLSVFWRLYGALKFRVFFL